MSLQPLTTTIRIFIMGLLTSLGSLGAAGRPLADTNVADLWAINRGEEVGKQYGQSNFTASLETHRKQDIVFADLPWLSPAAEVKAQVEAYGFNFVEADPDGDLVFYAQLPYGNTMLTAFMNSDAQLVKVVVMIAAPMSQLPATYQAFYRILGNSYGRVHEASSSSVLWVNNARTPQHSAVALSVTPQFMLAIAYESAFWSQDHERRRGLRAGVI